MKALEVIKANPKAVVITLAVVAGTIGTTIVVRKIRKNIKAKRAASEFDMNPPAEPEDETEE